MVHPDVRMAPAAQGPAGAPPQPIHGHHPAASPAPPAGALPQSHRARVERLRGQTRFELNGPIEEIVADLSVITGIVEGSRARGVIEHPQRAQEVDELVRSLEVAPGAVVKLAFHVQDQGRQVGKEGDAAIHCDPWLLLETTLASGLGLGVARSKYSSVEISYQGYGRNRVRTTRSAYWSDDAVTVLFDPSRALPADLAARVAPANVIEAAPGRLRVGLTSSRDRAVEIGLGRLGALARAAITTLDPSGRSIAAAPLRPPMEDAVAAGRGAYQAGKGRPLMLGGAAVLALALVAALIASRGFSDSHRDQLQADAHTRIAALAKAAGERNTHRGYAKSAQSSADGALVRGILGACLALLLTGASGAMFVLGQRRSRAG